MEQYKRYTITEKEIKEAILRKIFPNKPIEELQPYIELSKFDFARDIQIPHAPYKFYLDVHEKTI